jgi:hypothetical protein
VAQIVWRTFGDLEATLKLPQIISRSLFTLLVHIAPKDMLSAAAIARLRATHNIRFGRPPKFGAIVPKTDDKEIFHFDRTLDSLDRVGPPGHSTNH